MRNILKNNENNIKLDEIDLRIVELLQENGRTSDSEIARILKVSNDTIKRRREKLESANIIKIKAMLDPKKFGFLFYLHAAISTKPKANTNLLIEKLMQFKNAYYIATSLGPSHNILVHYRGKKREDLYEFVEWLRKQDEMQELDINMIYDVLKSGYHTIPIDQLI
jgi:Lrp/AsnC family transcriptional regulator for asnA, asnC and gidA